MSTVFACNKDQSRLEAVAGDLNQEVDFLYEFYLKFHENDPCSAAKLWCKLSSEFQSASDNAPGNMFAWVNPISIDREKSKFKLIGICMSKSSYDASFSASKIEFGDLKQHLNNLFGNPSPWDDGKGFEWNAPNGVKIQVKYDGYAILEVSINKYKYQ